MTRFNLLDGRMKSMTTTWAFGSEWVQGHKTWLAFWVRTATPAHYRIRKVKGVTDTVYN